MSNQVPPDPTAEGDERQAQIVAVVGAVTIGVYTIFASSTASPKVTDPRTGRPVCDQRCVAADAGRALDAALTVLSS